MERRNKLEAWVSKMVTRRDLVVASAGVGIAATIASQQSQADTIFTSFAYPVGVSTASRTTGTRFSDVLNVRDFGAVGDGTTDDTAAIQACFNAAYGSSSAPHNGLSSAGSPLYNNKSVFFPVGFYHITSPITMTGVVGGCVIGSGRNATFISISQGNSSLPAFKTNGCAYTTFSRLSISIPGNGSTGQAAVFELDWDGNNSSLGVSLQGNSFYDCNFGSGSYGCRIGISGFGGSGNIFVNCDWQTNGIAGLCPANNNAYSNTVIGCQPQGCAIGIWCPPTGGAVETIHGLSAQNSTSYDIVLESTVGAYSITGGRSESVLFLKVNNSIPVRVAGISQTQTASDTIFLNAASSKSVVALDMCACGGAITGSGNVSMRGCGFFASSIMFNSTVGAFTGTIAEYVSQGNANPWTVATLPLSSNARGLRTYISDSSFSVNLSTFFGSTIGSGGGSSVYVPVWSDGTNWRIG